MIEGSIAAMADELALIKEAEYESMNKGEVKQLLKNVAVYGTGMGVGTAIGHALNKTVGKKVFPGKPKVRKAYLTIGGALSGLLASHIMNKNLGLLSEARGKNARKRNT